MRTSPCQQPRQHTCIDYRLSCRLYLVLPSAEYFRDPLQNIAHRAALTLPRPARFDAPTRLKIAKIESCPVRYPAPDGAYPVLKAGVTRLI